MTRSSGSIDGEAFVRTLYDVAAGPLYAYVVRLTGDRTRAEDVVQVTMLRAWRQPELLDRDPESVRRWLFTVARNLVTDLRRSDAARPATVPDDGRLDALPTADDLERAVQAWTVAQALDRLTPEHRAVLVETYYQGHTVAEAAARLGIPPGTVKSRTYYALRALRVVLEEMGEVS